MLKNKIIAEQTLQTLNTGYYENKNGSQVNIKELVEECVNNTRLYLPQELEYLADKLVIEHSFDTKYEVTNETSLDACRKISGEKRKNLMCLNFASAKNPGGGFLGGAVAQEESIARASALYLSLLNAKEYYSFHKRQNTSLYSDHMIYSPLVPIFKFEDGDLMDEAICVNIITSPAVNAGAIEKNETSKIPLIKEVMNTRVQKLLTLSYITDNKTLILGAWGCGVFRNDPEMIAGLFYENLLGKFKNAFESVIFAVLTNNKPMIEAFEKRFL
jgi:uncharacterized protein (TIGR02452 family)